MTVYVDDAMILYKRGMKMSHMIADTTDELIDMADMIGVSRCHIQFKGKPKEHFDVCMFMRDKAISLGAIAISQRELAIMIKTRKTNLKKRLD